MELNQQTEDRAAVTLDLWLTLIAEVDGTVRSAKRHQARADYTGRVLADHGINVDRGLLLDASLQISEMVTSDHDLGIDLEYTVRIAQMLSLIEENLPQRLGDEGLAGVASVVDRAFLELPPKFLPGSRDVLESLTRLDIGVALISNTGLTSAAAYREWFDREDMLGFFDHLAFSNEVACAKPSPEIFYPTLGELGVMPENGLHIGDNLLTDISGAASIGMKTGWIAGFDNREPIIPPDYTLDSINDLPAVVKRWLESQKPIRA